MLKGSTGIVDRGFSFRTMSYRHEKVPNFGRCAVAQNASSPAAAVIRMRSCFNVMFSFSACLKGPSTWIVDPVPGPSFRVRRL